MIAVGFWKFDDHYEKKSKIIHWLYTVYSKSVPVVYFVVLIGLSIESIKMCLQRDSLRRISEAVAVLHAVLDAVVKIFIFYNKKIPDLFSIVKKIETDIWKSNDFSIKNHYRRQITYCRLLCSVVMTLVFATGTSFTVAGFVKLSRKEIDINSFMYYLWLPFDKAPYQTYLCVLYVILCYNSVIFIVCVKIVLITLIVFVKTHFQILQLKIKQLGSTQHCVPLIKSLIQEHLFLIRYSEKLNDSVKYILLLEYVLNSVNVASIIFQILTIESLIDLLFPVVHSITITAEIFALAWTATELKEQSSMVSDAIYKSRWYNLERSTLRQLGIMMIRAQTPMVLTIGPFSPMTTNTAVAIMKAAYSYVMLVMNRYDHE
ncbi:odorant receptor 67c-like [Rhynchophorus ferrugineus]